MERRGVRALFLFINLSRRRTFPPPPSVCFRFSRSSRRQTHKVNASCFFPFSLKPRFFSDTLLLHPGIVATGGSTALAAGTERDHISGCCQHSPCFTLLLRTSLKKERKRTCYTKSPHRRCSKKLATRNVKDNVRVSLESCRRMQYQSSRCCAGTSPNCFTINVMCSLKKTIALFFFLC